jgi:hypothetical protein
VTDGFYVDFAALQQAAEGVTDVLGAMATKQISDIDAPRQAFGHDSLGAKVADFCDRWNIGVGHLASDAQESADRLNASVDAYQHVDTVVGGKFAGVVQSPTGPDPAAQ